MILVNKHAVSLEGNFVESFKAYWFLDAPAGVTFNKKSN
jgi:hypothetical protein